MRRTNGGRERIVDRWSCNYETIVNRNGD